MAIKHLIFFSILTLLFYSIFVEPNLITVKRLNFKNDNIKNLKIVFVSDLHLSKSSKARFKRIIDKVNLENPDIVILGGDYVKQHNIKKSMSLDEIAQGLAKMHNKYGIYGVLGNHDYYADGKTIKNTLEAYGIKILENNSYKVKLDNDNASYLYIAGISDMQTTKYNPDAALFGTQSPVIFVSHSPDITPKIKGKVDLILSGHTHGGQIRIPFFGAIFVPSEYGKRFESGFVENAVYISRGLGTSILPLRFNCLPEITAISYR